MSENNTKTKEKISRWMNDFSTKANEVASDVIETVKETSVAVAEKASDIGGEVKEFTDDALEKIKESSDKLSKQLYEAKLEADKKRLMPIFREDLECANFIYPAMIRVVEYDKQHMENEACQGSVGFIDVVSGAKVLNIYKANIDCLKIQLHPNIVETIYYLSPRTTNFYVDLDDYFNYQKKQRINELNQIAYSLGAKYFKVTVMEEKKTFIKKDMKASAKGSIPGGDKVSGSVSSNDLSSERVTLKIESEMNLGGNDNPVSPELKYFAKENDILSLINMRLNKDNQLRSKTYQLKYNCSTIIKEKEAAQIDAAIKKFKIGGNISISSEVEQENRMTFEYYIEFPVKKK